MAVKETKPKETKKGIRMKVQEEKADSSERQLKIKLVRSLIGRPREQREVVRGLGLRKISSEVIRKDCPEIMGMIKKVNHLVKVEELGKK